MRVTEAEALTKWCPWSRVYVFTVPAATAQRAGTDASREVITPTATGGPANRYLVGNSVETVPENCRCIATRCMAWVWIGPEHTGDQRLGCCGMAHDRL